MLKKNLNFIFHIPRYIVDFFIFIYQKTLSPDHGIIRVFFPHGYCKFTPTCSMYARESIKKHGIIIGGAKALWRVMRCNPWSKGGSDPVK